MKVAAGKIFQSAQALNELMAMELPIRAQLILARNAKVLGGEFQTIQEKYFEVFKKYGDPVMKDEKPTGEYRLREADTAQANVELSSLFDTELPDVGITLLDPALLGDTKLTGPQMATLEWMFV